MARILMLPVQHVESLNLSNVSIEQDAVDVEKEAEARRKDELQREKMRKDRYKTKAATSGNN